MTDTPKNNTEDVVPADHLPFLYRIEHKYSWGWGPAMDITLEFRTTRQAFDAVPRYRVVHRDTREVVVEAFDATALAHLTEAFEKVRAKLADTQAELASECAYAGRLKAMVKISEARAQVWKERHDDAVALLVKLQSEQLAGASRKGT